MKSLPTNLLPAPTLTLPTVVHKVSNNILHFQQAAFHLAKQRRKFSHSFFRKFFKQFNGQTERSQRIFNVMGYGIQQQFMLGNELLLFLQIPDPCSDVYKSNNHAISLATLLNDIRQHVHLVPAPVSRLNFLFQDLTGVNDMLNAVQNGRKLKILFNIGQGPPNVFHPGG